MKKYVLLLVFVSCASIKENHVYICKSRFGKKYHYSQTCDGLNNCKHEVGYISIDEAQSLGYKVCDLEN